MKSWLYAKMVAGVIGGLIGGFVGTKAAAAAFGLNKKNIPVIDDEDEEDDDDDEALFEDAGDPGPELSAMNRAAAADPVG